MADLSVIISDLAGAHEDVGQNYVVNGDFENVPGSIVAATSTVNRWIDGTAVGDSSNANALGWATISIASSAQAGYANDASHSGTYSLKLSSLNTTGTIVVATYRLTPLGPLLIPLYPSTTYTISAWVKTNNVATSGVFFDLREYSSVVSTLATTSSAKLSGTNNWTQLSFNLTTNASTAYCTLLLRNNVAGNICDVWYDDLSITTNTPGGRVSIPISATVTPGVQDISGPKIWS